MEATSILQHPNVVHVLRIEIPQTKKLTFENTFAVDLETEEEFRKISEFRHEVVVASERQYGEAATNGVKKYLPCLFGLMRAAEKLPPDFCRSLKISWTSCALSDGYYNKNLLTHHNWYFEVLYVLLTYGLLHRKLALESLNAINDENFDSQCQEPSRLLREAAGIFDHIAVDVCSNFFPNLNEYPVPEMISDMFVILSELSQAESQQIVVKKAIRGGLSPMVLAKLCVAISNLYTHSIQLFEGVLKDKPKKFDLNMVLHQYMSLNKDLYSAITYKYMGIHYFQNGQPGYGVAYLEKANNLLKKKKYIPIPKSSNDSDGLIFWSKFENERNLISSIFEEFEKDNKDVYHDTVLDQEKVVFPEPKLMTPSIKFNPPPSALINVTPLKGGLCTIL